MIHLEFKIRFKYLLLYSAALTAFAILTSGCASVRYSPQTVDESPNWEEKGDDEAWRYVRFRWDWPLEEKPRWFMDYIAAHRIVAPVLRKQESEIDIWRFHRRAARDKSGHQFSVVFYSSRKTASLIFDAIGSDPLSTDLKTRGLLNSIVFDSLDAESVPRPRIEDTSDKKWSLAVQKSWPYYIMGVSRMWLELIDQIASETERDQGPFALEDLIGFYGEIERIVLEIWRNEGNHAFLHHLNAIFGYEPLVVYEKRMMQF